jgi:hypothetical protein
VREVKFSMEAGGVMLVHPRLIISASQGYATAYGLPKLERKEASTLGSEVAQTD